MVHHTNTCTCISNAYSIIYNRQNVEISQKSITCRWISTAGLSIQYGSKKKWNTDTCDGMDESGKHWGKWKRSVIRCDPVCMKCLKVDSWSPMMEGWGGGGLGCWWCQRGVGFGGRSWKRLSVVMNAQLWAFKTSLNYVFCMSRFYGMVTIKQFKIE